MLPTVFPALCNSLYGCLVMREAPKQPAVPEAGRSWSYASRQNNLTPHRGRARDCTGKEAQKGIRCKGQVFYISAKCTLPGFCAGFSSRFKRMAFGAIRFRNAKSLPRDPGICKAPKPSADLEAGSQSPFEK